MFKKILIANRGEIAIRVMRACRELDVKSVAVYSDADKNSLFAKYADEAYNIGESAPLKSYLNIEKIIDVAEEYGAEAIHPGYGFLAENPNLGKECEKHGIKLIGPKSSVIEAMGSKITARKLMKNAGVPIVPGTENGIKDSSKAIGMAESIGYPVMLKPSAGGGGIGMRIIYEEDELLRAIESTESLAESAFGDATVYLEKYIQEPRHIEFQILADEHGNTVHAAERECSIQRRNQKLIEEAPSPVMTETLREKMGSVAVHAASSIGYTNAGTVEFLYSNGNFYFLEMNTRVQVEHPITEAITGIDIVKQQIKIACGEELCCPQDTIRVYGHAIECRINAEDPLNNFTPNPGKITGYRSPGGLGVRVDSGVYNNYTIPSYYDSMISKLIVWGRDREEAISRMRRALSEYIILGVKTTIPFDKAMMASPHFHEGKLHTHFVDEYKNEIMDNMLKVIEEDKEMETRLKSTFLPSKKVAAVSAAVSNYMNQSIAKNKGN
jgi:pyruvate carboxylase subunit A